MAKPVWRFKLASCPALPLGLLLHLEMANTERHKNACFFEKVLPFQERKCLLLKFLGSSVSLNDCTKMKMICTAEYRIPEKILKQKNVQS